MKYLTVFVISLTVLLLAACSSGSGEPTVTPEATETKPALATAVATDESYPANPTPEPIDPYPDGMPTIEPYNPYPDQEADTASDVVTDSAYPAEANLSDIVSEPGTGQPQVAPRPGVPDESAAAVHIVSQAFAEHLGNDVSEITVVSVEAMEWSDSSLGCPAPGYAYAQVITPGFLITLDSGDAGDPHTYHTDLNGNFVLCGDDGQPVTQ
ncbi:MAG: hypothetical protein IAF02_03205 [Anaerolineae bacterium]|nr:hypothetical protein [Anaerolineae bacterium]